MTLRFRVENPLEIPDWDNQLREFPAATPFHTAAWARVLVDSYGFRPAYLMADSPDGRLAMLPVMEVNTPLQGKKAVSLPFTDFCPPLLLGGIATQPILEEMLRIAHQRKWKTVQFRGLGQTELPASGRFWQHDIDLRLAPDALQASFPPSTRRNINKAQREGVTIQETLSIEALNAYYDLHCQTRKRLGVPPQPISFFTRIYTQVLSRGFGNLLLAFQGKRLLAGAIFFHFGKSSLYKFGASDYAFQDLRANNLLIWSAIQLYQREGFEVLSLGRTDMEDTGLRRFKNSWSPAESLLAYHTYNLQHEAFETERPQGVSISRPVCRRLPISILKWAGTILYKYTA
jgi:hypothetical protein